MGTTQEPAEINNRRQPAQSGGTGTTSTRLPGQMGAVLGISLMLVGLSSCGTPQGDLAAAKELLASCPANRIASIGLIDTSGSVRGAVLPEAYAFALRDLVLRTAVCGGHLHVGAFSTTAASTVSLYDGDLQMPGSTENAQLRHVPEAVGDVLMTTENAYAQMVPSLPSGGTDIVAQYQLAHEYVQQLGGNRQLELLLLTDGLQNADFVLGDRALTEGEAEAMSTQVDIPQLTGATITVTGIGRTLGQGSVSTEVVTGMKRFYTALCRRTGAVICTSVTDYIPAGG